MKVKLLRKKNNFTQEEFAKRLGIKRTTYAYYESEDNFPADVLEKIAQDFEGYTTLEDLLRDNIKTDDEGVKNVLQEAEATYESIKREQQQTSVKDLRLHILRTLADNNRDTIQINAAHTRMLDAEPTADGSQQIFSTLLSKFSDLLEFVAEAGTNGWESKQEALAELNRRFYGNLQKEMTGGTQTG